MLFAPILPLPPGSERVTEWLEPILSDRACWWGRGLANGACCSCFWWTFSSVLQLIFTGAITGEGAEVEHEEMDPNRWEERERRFPLSLILLKIKNNIKIFLIKKINHPGEEECSWTLHKSPCIDPNNEEEPEREVAIRLCCRMFEDAPWDEESLRKGLLK